MIAAFTTSEAARLAGLPYATVDFWDRSGFLRPSVTPATGKGSDRAYSFSDVVALRTARELRQAGISLQALRRVVAYLSQRGDLERGLAQVYLVTDGHDVYERRGDEVLSVLRQPGQGCFLFMFDLTAAVDELRIEAVKLRSA